MVKDGSIIFELSEISSVIIIRWCYACDFIYPAWHHGGKELGTLEASYSFRESGLVLLCDAHIGHSCVCSGSSCCVWSFLANDDILWTHKRRIIAVERKVRL